MHHSIVKAGKIKSLGFSKQEISPENTRLEKSQNTQEVRSKYHKEKLLEHYTKVLTQTGTRKGEHKD